MSSSSKVPVISSGKPPLEAPLLLSGTPLLVIEEDGPEEELGREEEGPEEEPELGGGPEEEEDGPEEELGPATMRTLTET
jgi:hypothetical protein